MKGPQIALETKTLGNGLRSRVSAKALAALPELLGARMGDPALTTVFWHTGGLLDAVAGWAS